MDLMHPAYTHYSLEVQAVVECQVLLCDQGARVEYNLTPPSDSMKRVQKCMPLAREIKIGLSEV